MGKMVRLERKQTKGFASFGDLEISSLEGTIIASFFPEGEKMTIKEIGERLDGYYSYERLNSSLKSLADKKIVKEEKIGKTLVYSLDLTNLYSEIMGFNAYTLQREVEFIKKYKAVYQAIKEIIGNPLIWGAILFGSYSKGLETKQSDIVIICISHKNAETEQFV